MTEWNTIAPTLRTVLRPPSRPASRQQVALWEPHKRLFSYPIAPFLDALVVRNEAHTRTFINQEMVHHWALDAEVILRQGLSNLDPTNGLRQSNEHKGLWLLRPEDGYASSRLLMPGFLEAFDSKCSGEPIAVIPIEGMLFVADSADLGALEELMRQTWALYSQEAIPLSPVPYVRHEGFGLKPWSPIDECPVQSELTRAFLYMAGNEYAQQHNLLSEWAKQQDDAPFIAPFLMMKRGGHLGGMTVLPPRPALLPMATWVRCGTEDPKADAPLRSWEELSSEGIIGRPEEQWNPPRWRVP